MTPKEAEAYTRARWTSAEWTMGPNPWTLRISCPRYFDGTQYECWLAAAEFTLQREEEIRQKRIEVAAQGVRAKMLEVRTKGLVVAGKAYRAASAATLLCVESRILAILEAQLAALLVGMKETP